MITRSDPAAVGDLTERDLIDRVRAPLPQAPEWMTVGIGDDAAVVEPERNRLEVLTVDALVEGVHFDRAFTPPEAIGHRALAVNLSDLAAMGAAPRLVLLSMALPPSLAIADFDRIVGAFTALAARHRVHLAGGNLTRSPGPLMVDVTATGSVKRRRVLTRSGARAGDELYVTGTIGGAAAGLQMLAADGVEAAALAERADRATADGRPPTTCFLFPEPRVRAGVLVGRSAAASACMDLSDGLADAVGQVAAASGVGAALDAAALPVHPGAVRWFESRGVDPVEAALAGGDDYELLFAVRPRQRRRFLAAIARGGVPATQVGVCTADRRLFVRRAGGSESPLPAGFTHFR